MIIIILRWLYTAITGFSTKWHTWNIFICNKQQLYSFLFGKFLLNTSESLKTENRLKSSSDTIYGIEIQKQKKVTLIDFLNANSCLPMVKAYNFFIFSPYNRTIERVKVLEIHKPGLLYSATGMTVWEQKTELWLDSFVSCLCKTGKKTH